MIILGDFAYPYDQLEIPQGFFEGESVLINCEGYLTDNGDSEGVFNNINPLIENNAHKMILNLANNHVMDIATGVRDSIELTKKTLKLKTVGAGINLKEASKPFLFKENGIEVAVISAGWDVIGCKYATSSKQGVMPLNEKLIKHIVNTQKKLGRKIVIYCHWGYEL